VFAHPSRLVPYCTLPSMLGHESYWRTMHGAEMARANRARGL
jgi:hypothetical protein